MKHEPNPLKKPVDDNAKLAQAQCAAHVQVVTTPIVDSIKIRGMDFTVAEARALYNELGELFGNRSIPTYPAPPIPLTPPPIPYYTTCGAWPGSGAKITHNCEKGNW